MRAEYARREEAREAEHARLTRLDIRIGNARLALFGLGALVVLLALQWQWLSPWWAALPFAGFLALIVRHDRIIRQRERSARAIAFAKQGLARVTDRWQGKGVGGGQFADAEHPYAADLDIFGTGSLFERLCTARTSVGESCLADWLRAPADPPAIRARQEAIAELRPRLDLREEIALLGEESRAAIQPELLAAWGEEPPRLTSLSALRTGYFLAGCAVAALAAWGMGYGLWPLAAVALLEAAYEMRMRHPVKHVVHAVEKPARHLELVSLLLERIEREPFAAPRLRELRAALETEGEPPSARIARLEQLTDRLDYMRNVFFAPLGALLLWRALHAFAIEAWRARSGPHLRGWLAAIGEFEALCALASYAYENPEYPFPEIAESGAALEADGLAHPLIPKAQAVANAVRLGDAGTRLYLVSGSNMSGKSTLLRAVGTNAVLALAGAPVCAQRLRLSVLHLGASIRTQDSLQGGISRFYAEILRLRQIVAIADRDPSLLFLLDEILHGTNSHDRRVGAEAVIRALLQRGGIGLVTTHDLALARIAEDTALHAANVHFQDHLEEGKMVFDYRLRPGVVEKSNAIALMRAVGLEV